MNDDSNKQSFEREIVTEDQAIDLRRQLLTQRITQLEAEHVQASFGLEQIEQSIKVARQQLTDLAV